MFAPLDMERSLPFRAATMALLMAAALIPTSSAIESISSWYGPSAAVIQDLVFISGGDQFLANFTDGAWGTATRNKPPGGSLWSISLCDDIQLGTDADLNKVWTLWDNITTDNQYPNYIGGAMFTNNYEFYTYG